MRKRMARPRKAIDTSSYTGRFAERLKKLREKAGLSVDELAEKSGISRTTLFNWESATNEPKLGQLPQVAESLGVTVRTLIPLK